MTSRAVDWALPQQPENAGVKAGVAENAGAGAVDAGAGFVPAHWPEALYVHVPFCVAKCPYCDFNSHEVRGHSTDGFLQALIREMDLYAAALPGAGNSPAVQTLFVGGGTPTTLSADQLLRLFFELRRRVPMAPEAEVTVEANPGTADASRFEAVLRSGVNRLSLGFQSLDDELLRRIGRIHSAEEAIGCYRIARRLGFSNVNIDLMFALPGQSLEQWLQTLKRAIDLGPDHISAYNLTIEPQTAFGHLRARGELVLPEEEQQLEMLEVGAQTLEAAGYRRYEISNFARPGRECRHNLTYWENGQWLGWGPGAHSHLQGWRFANVRSPRRYAERLAAGQLPVEMRERLTPAQQMEETLMLGLRLIDGLGLASFRRRFGKDPFHQWPRGLEQMLAAGYLEVREGRLRLTAKGLPVANAVLLRVLS